MTLFAFAIFYPLRLSFLDPRGASPAWRAVDIALNAVFGFDILLTLRPGIVVDARRRALAAQDRAVARGWLLVDLLAALPLDLLVARPAGGLNLWAWSRFIKVLRLYSLGQYRYFDKVMKAVDVHFGVMTYLKVRRRTVAAQFRDNSLTAHPSSYRRSTAASPSSSACAPAVLLRAAASPSRRRGATASRSAVLAVEALNEMAIGDAYVVSIYWAVTTMRPSARRHQADALTAERCLQCS